MTMRVAERLDDWDSRSFTGGFHELNEFADREFSGIVRAGGAELYMTTGTVVGVERGTIEDFEDATGTVFEAPSPALPLLAVMQEADADVRAKYYSEDTPMAEVDSTLSDGSFTGYVELSENVLSGDYYLVYHGGRSMAVAFVGNSAKLITDDEAFETANDEVGIYKVRQVDVEPIEIPAAEGDRSGGGEGDDGAAAAAAAAGNAGASAATSEAEAESDDDPGAAETGSSTGNSASPQDIAAAAQGDDEADQTAETEPATAGGSDASTETGGAERGTGTGTDTGTGAGSDGDTGAGAGSDSDAGADSPSSTGGGDDGGLAGEEAAAGTGAAATDASTDRPAQEGSARSGDRDAPGRGGTTTTAANPDREGQGALGGPSAGSRGGGTTGRGPGRDDGTAPRGAAGGSAADLETRSIPSLDPERTQTPRRSSGATGGARGDAPGRGRAGGGDAGTTRQPNPNATASTGSTTEPQRGDAAGQADSTSQTATEPAGAGSGTGSARGESSGDAVAPERVEELQAELEEREAEVERLESELDRVTTEREDLKERLESAREERDELAEQVDRLESELSRLEEELGAATDAERRLTAREALDGTDVFVRYHSKGDATLQKAHDGSVRQDDVTDNLRLEKHTQFDASNVAVGGKNYPEFIEARPEYQFVRWTVEELLFEIRNTGHAEALQVLFDALPKVDRGELNGVIEVTFTEDGQETRTEETFDVILRDRMGNPLLVANLNDSREGATDSMMSDLITAAERVGQTTDSMAAAFLVTRSFFEPDALETAEEATRSGILSRDKRRSFVNISRKRGFHLCLVEARNQNFHLAVPEL